MNLINLTKVIIVSSLVGSFAYFINSFRILNLGELILIVGSFVITYLIIEY
jgi:hypothetical protein